MLVKQGSVVLQCKLFSCLDIAGKIILLNEKDHCMLTTTAKGVSTYGKCLVLCCLQCEDVFLGFLTTSLLLLLLKLDCQADGPLNSSIEAKVM